MKKEFLKQSILFHITTSGDSYSVNDLCTVFGTSKKSTIARALRDLTHKALLAVTKISGDKKGRKRWSPPGTPTTNKVSCTGPTVSNTLKSNVEEEFDSLNDAVEKVVTKFSDAGKTFAAYNITSYLREMVNGNTFVIKGLGSLWNGTKYVPRVRHDEVRLVVHDLFDVGKIKDYKRDDNGTYYQYSPHKPPSLTSSF